MTFGLRCKLDSSSLITASWILILLLHLLLQLQQVGAATTELKSSHIRFPCSIFSDCRSCFSDPECYWTIPPPVMDWFATKPTYFPPACLARTKGSLQEARRELEMSSQICDQFQRMYPKREEPLSQLERDAADYHWYLRVDSILMQFGVACLTVCPLVVACGIMYKYRTRLLLWIANRHRRLLKLSASESDSDSEPASSASGGAMELLLGEQKLLQSQGNNPNATLTSIASNGLPQVRRKHNVMFGNRDEARVVDSAEVQISIASSDCSASDYVRLPDMQGSPESDGLQQLGTNRLKMDELSDNLDAMNSFRLVYNDERFR